MRAYASGSRGSPHSSHSVTVSGSDGSSIVVTTSTNGTSATIAPKRSGRRFATAPIKSPPALPPSRREPRRRRVVLGDQVLRARDEVGERVGLVLEPAGLVPRAAHLASAPHVRHREDETAIEEREPRDPERRIGGDLVGAVAVQQRGGRAVERRVPPVHQRDGDLRAVGRASPTAAPRRTARVRSRRGRAGS